MQTRIPEKIKRRVDFYNMVVNLFRSVLHLVPISVFCYGKMSARMFSIFLVISLFALMLPKNFFNNIQLGKTSSIYKKLGVKFINRFTQNGDIINRLIRKKFPEYKIIYHNNISVNKLLQQTYIFEKFHFAMFSFFTLVAIYAFVLHYVWWGVIITVSNLAYNVYPNLLQQYVRIKLLNVRRGK